MLCHFVEDLLAPALNTLVAKVILVSFIQRQTHEQLPVSNHRFRAGKFISFRWPVADELHAFGREFVMQHTERIEEPLAVSQLIAKPIQRNNFTFKVQVVELIPDGFPVFPISPKSCVGIPRMSTSYCSINFGESSLRLCKVTSSGPIISRIFLPPFRCNRCWNRKKTHIHNVSFSILLWLLQLVYQNRFSHGTIRHNGSNE